MVPSEGFLRLAKPPIHSGLSGVIRTLANPAFQGRPLDKAGSPAAMIVRLRPKPAPAAAKISRRVKIDSMVITPSQPLGREPPARRISAVGR